MFSLNCVLIKKKKKKKIVNHSSFIPIVKANYKHIVYSPVKINLIAYWSTTWQVAYFLVFDMVDILPNVNVNLHFLFVSFKIVSKSVPITTKVLSSNPVNREVYSIQHYHLCDKVCQ